MRSILRSVAATGFLFAPIPGAAAQDTRPAPPQIVTNGQGEVRVAPDQASVSIGVQTRAGSAAGAVAENSRKQRLVIAAIRATGVAPELITTSAFSVQPETQVDRTGQSAPRTTSYLVSNVVTVDLRRSSSVDPPAIDLVGPVIDAALGAGANQIRSLTYAIANPDSARRAAITVAVARAKGDAEAAARSAGGSLGPLLELSTSSFLPAARQEYEFMEMATARVSAEAVPVEPGMQVVRAAVTGRWRFIQPGAP